MLEGFEFKNTNDQEEQNMEKTRSKQEAQEDLFEKFGIKKLLIFRKH
ncbi:MAG: hypothetical protein GWO87_00690 [Xanthomonadaceae bacterium]|nr:hypothetical protein [Rhodospirillaceae bacterium]NIA17695.1 hypothetical protein [Xanthomonadaceae bacterium]